MWAITRFEFGGSVYGVVSTHETGTGVFIHRSDSPIKTMQTVTVDHPREEADAVVRAAFEQTDAIRVYHIGENRAIGKTGVRRVSWGERVILEFAGDGDSGTEFSVHTEKEVSENVMADPETVESAVLDGLVRASHGEDTTRARSLGEDTTRGDGSTNTREVTHPGDLPSGRRAALLFLGLFLPLISVPAALLGADVIEATVSGSLMRIPLFLGLFSLWAALAGGVGLLVTWYHEGTLRQRLLL